MHLITHLKTKAVIILTLIAISFSSNAQAPNLLNYQGVARNAVGNPLPNQTMNLRLSVHNLSAAGTVVYSETRVIRTNLGGLFSVQVGSAGSSSVSGTIGGVSWLSGDKYLQVEIDPASNNNYLNLGTVQLVSVPYAFNAVTATNALTVTTNANLTGAVTSNGNLTSLAASPALTGVPTAPTAAPGTNTTQIATTEFVKAAALTGPTGAKGVQGLAGADGAAGAQGIQGLTGANGAAGAQGIQGLTGADGAAGAQGIKGIQGLTGSVANVAAISGTSTANGASITSGVLSLAPADANNGGIITTGAQIFAGAKTFNTTITGSINGNAATASKATILATARKINNVDFDGSGDISVTADAGTLTGTTLNATVTGSSLTSVGTIQTGVWSGTSIAVTNGGTGTTNGSITGTGTLTFTAGGSNQNISIIPSGTGSVGIGTSIPNTSAVLEASSKTQGFLPPRMTEAKRNLIVVNSASAGLIIWCTNCGVIGELNVYNGTSWTNMMGTTAATATSVTIGTQKWSITNLDVTTYRNGDPIDQVTDPTAWAALTTGAWCYYNNDAANGAIYGKLYNWYAVNDPRGLAPTGWHIPTDPECTTLTNYLGGWQYVGGKMKTTGTSLWTSPNTGATNESDFAGLPGGYREYEGTFTHVGINGYWWTASEAYWWSSLPNPKATLRYLKNSDIRLVSLDYYKNAGFSVRCIKN
jgi:uncharacterized protein (TIGR02145 family)